MLEMMREDPDGQEDGDSTPEVLQKLAAKGGEFAEALQKVPPVGSCVLTFGEVRETLGSTRLELIQFLLAMLRSGCVCLQPASQEGEILTAPRSCPRSACAGGKSADGCLTMGCSFVFDFAARRSAEVAGMFVSSSLAQPLVALFFDLPFNNLLHNLVLQIVREH